LDRFIKAIETATEKEAKRNNRPMQAGDVARTYSDVSGLMASVNFKLNTQIKEGIQSFVN